MATVVLSSYSSSEPQTPFALHHPLHTTTRGPSMLKSLKQKLSSHKKSASSRSSSFENENTFHPQASLPPPTRRPAPTTNYKPSINTNEPPPAYTLTPTPTSPPSATPIATSSTTATTTATDADPYAFLSSFDTIFLIDDSGSMSSFNRWPDTAQALSAITSICVTHDADGIDLYFLNNPDRPAHHNVTSASIVREIFSTVRPFGRTPTGQRLDSLLRPYIRRLESSPEGSVKPINIICITDGSADDDVASSLIWAARKLDKLDAPAWQVGVQFFQIGNDVGAKENLEMLDGGLREIAGDVELRDIVDTVPFKGDDGARLTADGILKVVLGAVNRRLDRMENNCLHR